VDDVNSLYMINGRSELSSVIPGCILQCMPKSTAFAIAGCNHPRLPNDVDCAQLLMVEDSYTCGMRSFAVAALGHCILIAIPAHLTEVSSVGHS
jgi:hypothetical protein